MNRCFHLAKNGLGNVSPNPLVGAVIVANDRIIGEGWHNKFGGAHAEVNAFESVGKEHHHLLPESTLYVNLEPCNHHGKTPPCVDLLLEKKIPRVVISTVDSNPLVGGMGIKKLRENGVHVEIGILKEEGRSLNKRFFTFIEEKRPYVILKWAQTLDGLFAKNTSKQTWITTEMSRRIVHKWRSEEDAILIGKNTLTVDKPKLNNRYFSAEKQPIRIVISAKVPQLRNYHFFDESQPSVIINSETESIENHMQYWQFDFNRNLLINILERLYKEKVQSVIIEGGAYTLQQFLDENLWDEARILTGIEAFDEGKQAPTIKGTIIDHFHVDSDMVTYYKNN